MLRDFQQQMAQAVLHGTVDRSVPVPGVLSPERLSVHRITVQDSLRQTLAAAYPCLESVLGARNFGVLARAYIKAHPPQRPVLAFYGEGLAAFLETYPHTADQPALTDLARLEWACLQAAFARDEAVLNLAGLQALPADSFEGLNLPLHPATQLLRLSHDVDRFKSGDIDWRVLTRMERSLAVLRSDTQVAVCVLGVGETALLSALSQGLDLETAAQQALSRQADFDLQGFLLKFLPLGAFAFPV